MPSRPSSPTKGSDALERRVARGSVVTLAVLAAVAWLLTIRTSFAMPDMVMGIAQVGRRMPLDMGAPLFLAMWLTMMVAMMFPSIGPMILAHRLVVSHRGEGVASTLAFVGGYLVIWTLAGLVPLTALLAFRNVAANGMTPHALAVAAGGALVLCGAYQFTPWKTVCLRACRTPLGFILTHNFAGRERGAFLAGLWHGAYCLGCCWALMAVLAIVGLMNLVWMAVFTLIFFAEKNWRYGSRLHLIVGTAVAVLGCAVAGHPEFLTTLGGPSGEIPTGAMRM